LYLLSPINSCYSVGHGQHIHLLTHVYWYYCQGTLVVTPARTIWYIHPNPGMDTSTLALKNIVCKGNLTDLRRILHLTLAKG
jgi:hypothetical protein